MKKRLAIAILVLAIAVTSACGIAVGYNAVFPSDTEPCDIRVVRAVDSEDGYTTIYKPSDRDLKILDFTDPQIKPYMSDYVDYFDGSNENTIVFLERFVEALDPDLVIITGDIVHSMAFSNLKHWDAYCEMFEEQGVYWAPTFGNHDSETQFVSDASDENSVFGQATKAKTVEYLSAYEHCLIEEGDAEEGGGTGNYFINIRDYTTEEIVYTLCMMDCVSDTENKAYYRKKTPEQVAWYERHINAISDLAYGEDREDTEVVKSMIFTHVAVPEVFEAYELAWNDGNPTSDYYYGILLEGNANNKDYRKCTLFDKITELGSTTAMFFGHHHNNGFRVKYKGVDLVYGQHSGLAHYYRMDVWDGKNVDMTDIFTYGDERGGVEIKISSRDSYTIERKLAVDTIEYDDIRIDYEALARKLLAMGYNLTGIPEELRDAA